MTRGKELVGLPVIELVSGKQVGLVDELLLDLEGQKLSALLIKSGGWVNDPHPIGLESINQVGPDAITLREGTDLGQSGNDSSEPSDKALCRMKDLRGLRVLNPEGKEIGTLEDVLMDFPEGHLKGWEMSDGLIQDMIKGRTELAAEQIQTFGTDRIITR